jgi:hypothetical protein
MMLIEKLEDSTDNTTLSRWAYQTYLDNSRNLDPDLKDVLLDLTRMKDAREFQYSASELFELARKLIGGDGTMH